MTVRGYPQFADFSHYPVVIGQRVLQYRPHHGIQFKKRQSLRLLSLRLGLERVGDVGVF